MVVSLKFRTINANYTEYLTKSKQTQNLLKLSEGFKPFKNHLKFPKLLWKLDIHLKTHLPHRSLLYDFLLKLVAVLVQQCCNLEDLTTNYTYSLAVQITPDQAFKI